MRIERLIPTNSHSRAIESDGKSKLPISSQFSRAAIKEAHAQKSASSVKDSQGSFSEPFESDAGRVLSAVAYRLQPGKAMRINVNGAPQVLYRLTSGNALVLQNPTDFKDKVRSGLFLGIGSSGNKIMSLNGVPIMSRLHSSFPLAYGQLISLKGALGVQ